MPLIIVAKSHLLLGTGSDLLIFTSLHWHSVFGGCLGSQRQDKGDSEQLFSHHIRLCSYHQSSHCFYLLWISSICPSGTFSIRDHMLDFENIKVEFWECAEELKLAWALFTGHYPPKWENIATWLHSKLHISVMEELWLLFHCHRRGQASSHDAKNQAVFSSE